MDVSTRDEDLALVLPQEPVELVRLPEGNSGAACLIDI